MFSNEVEVQTFKELLEAAKKGGIQIPTPDTATKENPAAIARKLRSAVRHYFNRTEDSWHQEIYRHAAVKALSRPLSKAALKNTTKEQMNEKLAAIEKELVGFEERRNAQWKLESKSLKEIVALAQQLPVIEDSPQGTAENAVRAIAAILKSNGLLKQTDFSITEVT